MQQITAAVSMTLFPCLCTILGAGLVFFMGEEHSAGARRAMLGLAGGIMLAGALFNLLLPAMEQAEKQEANGWIAPAGGLMAGAGLLLVAERLADGLLAEGQGHCGRIVLAMALHNLPQGMVVGLVAAMGVMGQPDAAAGAMALSMGIGLQNVPEGAAVSLPVRQAGASRIQAFLAGAASSLMEPLGAALAGALAGCVLVGMMPWLLSLAAGLMLCVVAQEMLPTAAEAGGVGILAMVTGFALMLALESAL